MKKLLILSVSALLLAGISHAQTGGVAILDIDSVAKELGVEESVKNELQSMQNGLNGELQRAQANLQSQMKNAEQVAGTNPNEQQKAQLVQTNQQLNTQFNQLKAQAQNTLAQERVKKINDFREKLKPIALEAAKAKGLGVVLMQVTPPVYAFDEGVDITEATLAAAKKAGMQSKPAAAAPAPATPAPDPAPAADKGKAKAKKK